jgi:ketosteroid isomerase-like protein
MSQENLNALKGLYERWRRETGPITRYSTPYAVGVFPDPTPRAHYGLNALADYVRRFLESWDDVHMEGTDYREAGDSFVVRIHRVAKGRGSGIQLEDDAFHVWTFRGRRAIRVEVFDRESEALEAAGLSE